MTVVTPTHPCSCDVSERVTETTRTELILDHLRLADALAGRYRGRGVDHEDLQQVARGGLVEAANRFDPAIGAFAAFAAPIHAADCDCCSRME